MSVLSPTPEAIQAAARTIREGGMVVLPTETVYGLACDAMNEEAVRRVFETKGRPSDNPLILHIADLDQVGMVAGEWPEAAQKLAEKFWPGPLTLVVPKAAGVPDVTTAGLQTAAVRMPSHPVTLEVIRLSRCVLAAPSANVFMGLSPTSADALDPEILVETEIVLDGGPCEIGIESTVVDLSDGHPRILRPGDVSRADIQAGLGSPLGHIPPIDVRRSPGMYRRHYAPKAAVRLVDQVPAGEAGLTFGEAGPQQIKMPRDAKAYGAVLYGALRHLDQAGTSTIFVEMPPDEPAWEAVLDRLRKASASLA